MGTGINLGLPDRLEWKERHTNVGPNKEVWNLFMIRGALWTRANWTLEWMPRFGVWRLMRSALNHPQGFLRRVILDEYANTFDEAKRMAEAHFWLSEGWK